jgi:hypothetical protein
MFHDSPTSLYMMLAFCRLSMRRNLIIIILFTIQKLLKWKREEVEKNKLKKRREMRDISSNIKVKENCSKNSSLLYDSCDALTLIQ